MRIVKKEKKIQKFGLHVASTSILENGVACWDPYREYQISASDRVQNKAAKFAQCTGGSVWESLAHRRMTARLCALYKAYNSERAWKDTGDSLQEPYYLSMVYHFWKIRARMMRTDVGKFYFVNRTTAEWNQLLEGMRSPACQTPVFIGNIVGSSVRVSVHKLLATESSRQFVTESSQPVRCQLSKELWKSYRRELRRLLL
jgi:hypothetical protein